MIRCFALFIAMLTLAACISTDPTAPSAETAVYELRFRVDARADERAIALEGARMWAPQVTWTTGPDWRDTYEIAPREAGSETGTTNVIHVTFAEAWEPTVATKDGSQVGWGGKSLGGRLRFAIIARGRWRREPALVAHELGHAMGLGHLPEQVAGVMSPYGGTTLTPADLDEFCRVHFCDATPGVSP